MNDTTTFTVGDLVRSERVKRRLTQEQLAQAAGISLNTLHFLETGKTQPSFNTIRKLAQALGVTVDSLNPPVVAA